MKRLPVVVALFLCLGANNGPKPGTLWWWRTPAAWASGPKPYPAAKFALAWAHIYDYNAYIRHDPIRIIAAGCVHDGEAIYVCAVTLRNHTTGSVRCARLLVGTDGTIFGGRTVTCKSKPVPVGAA